MLMCWLIYPKYGKGKTEIVFLSFRLQNTWHNRKRKTFFTVIFLSNIWFLIIANTLQNCAISISSTLTDRGGKNHFFLCSCAYNADPTPLSGIISPRSCQVGAGFKWPWIYIAQSPMDNETLQDNVCTEVMKNWLMFIFIAVCIKI